MSGLLLRLAIAVPILLCPFVVPAAASTTTTSFAVMRNEDRIGTNTIRTEDDGKQTTFESVTHVAVKMLFMTVYHFDQTETERWCDGRFLTMSSTTDDNGTIHRASAVTAGESIVVDGDGNRRQIGHAVVPASLWNPAVLAQNEVLNLRDGQVVPVKVTDRGVDSVVMNGQEVRAHRYVITAGYTQEAWYDSQNRLLKVQMRAPDGSTIRYIRL